MCIKNTPFWWQSTCHTPQSTTSNIIFRLKENTTDGISCVLQVKKHKTRKEVILITCLFPSLFCRRDFKFSCCVILGIKQVNVIWGVAHKDLLAIFTVAQGCYPAGFVVEVRRDKTCHHSNSAPASIIPFIKKKKKKWRKRGGRKELHIY